jgi:hypothetical protein
VNLTFVQTNNGGIGGPGFYLAGLKTVDGTAVWERRDFLYPAPRLGDEVPPVPATGIPAGVAAFDREGTGFVSHIAVPSLYGDLFLVEAGDGATPFGNDNQGRPVPLFRFSGDFHPVGASPTIYADISTGKLHAAFASGGYADPIAATWIQLDEDQFVVSVSLDPNPGNVPINETAAGDFGGDRAFVQNIGAGVGFAQAIVAGNELFVTTDSSDVNLITYGTTPTGTIRRYSLSGGAQVGSAIQIAGGASSPDVDLANQNVVVGTGGAAQKLGMEAAFGSAADQGRAIELDADKNTTRLLWISS